MATGYEWRDEPVTVTAGELDSLRADASLLKYLKPRIRKINKARPTAGIIPVAILPELIEITTAVEVDDAVIAKVDSILSAN